MKTTFKKTIDATKENIAVAITTIEKFATDNGYQIIGEFTKEKFLTKLFGGNKPSFTSKCQEKACRNYLFQIDKKPGMRVINQFLHFLYKRVYKLDNAPKVEYSDKELKIKSARASWKKAHAEAEKLLATYKEEKVGFYKK